MALSTGTKASLAVLLTGAVGYLVLSDTGEGVLEYVYADKVVADPAAYRERTIRVHGVVVPGTIESKVGQSADYRFVVESSGMRLRVHFTNLVPDTFQEGGEVVLTGRLSDDGQTFVSDEMSAKCPSKYEAEASVRGAVPDEVPGPRTGQAGGKS